MEVHKIVVGSYACNCYLLVKDNNAIIIDPGAGFKKINQIIEDLKIKDIKACLLTHGHFDHIGAVDKLHDKYHFDVYLDNEDLDLVNNPKINSAFEYDGVLKTSSKDYPNDELIIDDYKFKIFKTPGHTKGSVCLLIDNYLFTGDTLFKNSIGRTDLYGGSYHQIMNSLNQIKNLDPNLLVLPGHEEITILHDELKYNPFLK